MFEPERKQGAAKLRRQPAQKVPAPRRLDRQIDAVLRRSGSRILTPVEVHDLRVAIARLRVGFSIFRKQIGPRRRRRIDRALRRLRRSLGPVRDLDVLRTHLLSRARGRQGELIRALLKVVARQRHQALQDARLVVEEETAGGLRRQLRKARRRVRERIGERLPKRRAQSWIDVRLQKVHHQAAKLGSDDSEAIHRLRMDIKKLRYATELLAAQLPQDRVGHFVETLTRIQDRLGEAHDAAVRQGQLADLRAAIGGRSLRASVRREHGAATRARRTDVSRCRLELLQLEPFWAAQPPAVPPPH